MRSNHWRRRGMVCGVAGFVVALCTGLAPLPATAASPAVDAMGTWSLARLGYDDLALSGSHLETSVPIDLPAGASQGPKTWWQLYLHVQIAFRPDATGIAYLTGSMDGAASASIKFDFDHGPSGGMAWNTADVNGEINYVAAAHSVDFDFSNYVQSAGIHGGSVPLSFTVESFTGSAAHLLDRATISAAKTGLVWNTDGPYDVGLDIGDVPQSGTVGDEVTVPYTVTNTDALAARGLQLSADASPGLEIVGRSLVAVPAVTKAVHGELKVRLTSGGEHQLLLRVLTDGRRARAAKVLNFSVDDKPDRTFVYVLGGIAAALLVLGGYLAYRRPKRR